MVKTTVFEKFDVKLLNKQYDGILSIQLQHKISKFITIINSCYLPPENSPYGRDIDDFFSHLIHLLYMTSYADCMCFGGDLNARIGHSIDNIPHIDQIKPRCVIDNKKNKHGESFIDFLIDSKMCIE